MIIDSHAHLDARILDLEAIVRKMDQAGVDRIALIPAMNDPVPQTPELLLNVYRRLMTSRVGRPLAERLHRFLLSPEGDVRLGGKIIQIYNRPDNAVVAAAVAKYPQRFLGWIFLNPRNNPSVLEELERWRHEPGMIGVKLHPHWHDYRTEQLYPLLARLEELRLPILIHLGFGSRGDYRAMVEKFPKLVVISAHAGFPFFQTLWAYGRTQRNLHVDLSSPYIDEPLARAAVKALGSERCLYGTDSPYGFHEADGSYDYGTIRGWVERLPVSSAEQEGILGGNFAALLARPG